MFNLHRNGIVNRLEMELQSARKVIIWQITVVVYNVYFFLYKFVIRITHATIRFFCFTVLKLLSLSLSLTGV